MLGQSVDAVLNLALRFHHKRCSSLSCHVVRCSEVVVAACVNPTIPIQRIAFSMKWCAKQWGATRQDEQPVVREVHRGFALYNVAVPAALAQATKEPEPAPEEKGMLDDSKGDEAADSENSKRSEAGTGADVDTHSAESSSPVLGADGSPSPRVGVVEPTPSSPATRSESDHMASPTADDAPPDMDISPTRAAWGWQQDEEAAAVMAPFPARQEDEVASLDSDYSVRLGEEVQRRLMSARRVEHQFELGLALWGGIVQMMLRIFR